VVFHLAWQTIRFDVRALGRGHLLGSLVPEPSPAMVGSTHNPAPSRVNQNVITDTRELEESEIFRVV
jgi:hypothetical protein